MLLVAWNTGTHDRREHCTTDDRQEDERCRTAIIHCVTESSVWNGSALELCVQTRKHNWLIQPGANRYLAAMARSHKSVSFRRPFERESMGDDVLWVQVPPHKLLDKCFHEPG
jgi:hypothetical protein